MPELKHTFQGGKMDKDVDDRIVPNGQYREALNIGVASSEDSDVGAAQNILGNIKVTEAIQSRSLRTIGVGAGDSSSNVGKREYEGDNYHIAAVVDQRTDMLYRFLNTESDSEGIWMDRIAEYDTTASHTTPWYAKEAAVMVDIYKVRDIVTEAEPPCPVGANKYGIKIDLNTNQVRWGMVISIDPINTALPETVVEDNIIVEDVNYSSGTIRLSENLDGKVELGDTITFHGDRNLNFHKDRNITGINIIDGMLFWTDNYSEPKKVHIERGKMGSNSSLHTANPLLIGRGVEKIDDFNQHTLLIVEDVVQEDCVKDDSFCIFPGCMDPLALNYDPTATIDDGSCIMPISGCTCGGDALNGTINGLGVYNDCWGDGHGSSNFDPLATIDDGSCIQCVMGCMDVTACNYDVAATCDDGSCLTVYGCTDSLACNYDKEADCDDGSCILPDGCTDPFACNYDPLALCDDGSCCGVAPGDCGCTDITACNYNPLAICDDGSCSGSLGCTDSSASNYDLTATCDDGSCEYIDCHIYKNCNDPSLIMKFGYWYVPTASSQTLDAECSGSQHVQNYFNSQLGGLSSNISVGDVISVDILTSNGTMVGESGGANTPNSPYYGNTQQFWLRNKPCWEYMGTGTMSDAPKSVTMMLETDGNYGTFQNPPPLGLYSFSTTTTPACDECLDDLYSEEN